MFQLSFSFASIGRLQIEKLESIKTFLLHIPLFILSFQPINTAYLVLSSMFTDSKNSRSADIPNLFCILFFTKFLFKRESFGEDVFNSLHIFKGIGNYW